MKINPDRIIGFIVISLGFASGVILILISETYQDKLDILWKRYDDPGLAKKLALVLGSALVVGAVLFCLSSICWLCIFDTAEENKKRKYRKAQQRRLAKAKSLERQNTEQSQRVAEQQIEAAQSINVSASAAGGAASRALPSCPPEAALDVHDPLMYSTVSDPMHPPPYESVIMQECMKFPFADDV